jgi:hypothetical protein
MTITSFDRLTTLLRRLVSRRTAAGVLAGTAVPRLGDARRRKRRKRKKNKKVAFNDFGCVDTGKHCKSASQCCSGICHGKKGKKTCRAHDASTCAGQEGCAGEEAFCTTTSGDDGLCFVTTGKAPFCAYTGTCFACTKDADCEPVCGAGAACTVCPGCEAGIETACSRASPGPCMAN